MGYVCKIDVKLWNALGVMCGVIISLKSYFDLVYGVSTSILRSE